MGYVRAAFCFLATVLTFSTGEAVAGGVEQYSPTKQQWLLMLLNSELSNDPQLSLASMLSEQNVSIMMTSLSQIPIARRFAIVRYDAGKNPDTIVVRVTYTPDTDRAFLNMIVDAAKQRVLDAAKALGWDKWVRVREEVTSIGPGP